MSANEIIEQLEQFTEEEKERINQLAAQNVEELTQEDLELYSRWQVSNALMEERFELEKEQQRAISQAKIENARAVRDEAISLMKTRKAIALAKLQAVENSE